MAQFNKGVEESKEQDRHQKRVDKADRRRKQAAAEMKQVLDADPTTEAREAAEAEYRAAVDAWQALVSGSTADADADAAEAPGDIDQDAAGSPDGDDDTPAGSDGGDDAGDIEEPVASD